MSVVDTPVEIIFDVTEQPTFLMSTGNPMLVKCEKSPYSIGQLFYLELWCIPSKRVLSTNTPRTGAFKLSEMVINGDGTGKATFDISDLLNTNLSYQIPDPYNYFQKNTAGYCGYFYKVGYITYNAQNQQVKNQCFDSGEIKWCIKAALPLTASGDLSESVFKFDYEPVGYLTNTPDFIERRRTEDTFLSFFLPQNYEADEDAQVTLEADLFFSEGTPELNVVLSSHTLSRASAGGLYIINVRPDRLVGSTNYNRLVKYTVRVKYQDDITTYDSCLFDKTFLVVDDIQSAVPVMFLNRSGGWDTVQFRGESTKTVIKTKSSTFTNGFNERIYKIDSTSVKTYNSNFLNESEYEWLKDLKLSPVVVINGAYVKQVDGDFKIDDLSGLSTYELNVNPEFEENTIKM